MTIIEKLKQYMQEYNLNQKQLASLLSITESHLSRIMSGKYQPGHKILKQYRKLPGVMEREALREFAEMVDSLWIKGEISAEVAKVFLTKLKPGN